MVSFARAEAFIEKGKVFQKPDNMIMKAQRVSDRSRTQSDRFFFFQGAEIQSFLLCPL